MTHMALGYSCRTIGLFNNLRKKDRAFNLNLYAIKYKEQVRPKPTFVSSPAGSTAIDQKERVSR